MSDDRILVVGAGPSGLAAAAELASAGAHVILADQAAAIGGAVYAENRTGKCRAAEFLCLQAAIDNNRDRIELRCETVFAGLDYRGAALLTGARPLLFRPRALVLATGARERVQPRPGWTLPGVVTVGAAQIDLKCAGPLGHSRIVVAGSGPLLYALGAQLCRAGTPPVAIIEAGRPFSHPLHSLRLA